MATKKNSKKDLNYEVRFAKKWKDGGITFTLDLFTDDGRMVSIYNCRIMDGRKNSNFISFPSRKGTDGKYYSHAYVELSQEEQDAIIETVIDTLDE